MTNDAELFLDFRAITIAGKQVRIPYKGRPNHMKVNVNATPSPLVAENRELVARLVAEKIGRLLRNDE